MRAVPVLALVFAAQSVSAQVPQLRRSGLPRDVVVRLESVVAEPGTRRIDGDAAIPADEVVRGSVYATGGVLRVAGVIEGELIVVDGDVVFESGAEVAGDVTVVGGRGTGTELVRLAGTFTEYGEGFGGWVADARRIHDGRSRWDDERRWWAEDERGGRYDLGNVELAVRVAENYNRVEGLPLQFGPSIRTGGPSPTRLEALAIWRTAVGSLGDTDRMGWQARAEQFVGPHLRLGVSARNVVQPIDPWGVTSIEASLAAALFHEDQRDYFEREGWSAYLRVAPRRSPVDLTVEYRDEDHRVAPVRDPWTLFDRGDLWRLQPVVAEGRFRSLHGALELDLTRGRGFVADGWWLRLEAFRGLEGELATPALQLPGGTVAPARTFDRAMAAGLVDLRRYEPVGWAGSLAIRILGGGSFEPAPLAPQFQHALGGAGSMPGYDLLSVDCGARGSAGSIATGVGGAGDRWYGGYGCDRFALFQAEYRGGFDLHFGDPDDDRNGHWRHLDASVDWTVFFDAGKGWRYDDAGAALDTGMLYDAGVGVILGDFGVYGAVPLTGAERGVRMFVRLGPRF